MRNAASKIWRLVGTAQDITEQKQAEDQVVKNLEIADSARTEADALRKATLSLPVLGDLIWEPICGGEP
jgi:hypothetical protein